MSLGRQQARVRDLWGRVLRARSDLVAAKANSETLIGMMKDCQADLRELRTEVARLSAPAHHELSVQARHPSQDGVNEDASTPNHTSIPDYWHKEYPKTLRADDFWGQVGRVGVNGGLPSDEEVRLIVDSIEQGLSLGPTDVLVEFACGNGALSRYL
jgi:hypothetical protein